MASNKPFSISLKSSASKPSNSKKRPHSSLADASESEEEDLVKAQIVLGFDNAAGGAISKSHKTAATTPLVIQTPKNRDWREEAERKKGRNLLPTEELARRAGKVETSDKNGLDADESERVWGLVVAQRNTENPIEAKSTDGKYQTEQDPPDTETSKPQTADEEALAALLGDKKKDSGLVISATATTDDRFAPRATEGDIFRADVNSRPDAASLTDYSIVPVEDFGKALMRGMGWREGMEIGRLKNKAIEDKGKKTERRAARLGIGAKELPQELAEPGAWGKGAKKGDKALTTYNPMRIKNKQTGEVLTEDEFKAKQENQKLLLDTSRHGKDGRDARSDPVARGHRGDDDQRDLHRHRDRDRDRDRDSNVDRGDSSYHSRTGREHDTGRRDRDRESRKHYDRKGDTGGRRYTESRDGRDDKYRRSRHDGRHSRDDRDSRDERYDRHDQNRDRRS